MDTNVVLAGKYNRCIVKSDANGKVYLENAVKSLDGPFRYSNFYLDKTNVLSIDKLHEETDASFKTGVSVWLGSGVAAGLSDMKDIVLKITWVDNTESMIKVTDAMYTKILATEMSTVNPHAGISKQAFNNPPPKPLSKEEKKHLLSGFLAVLVLLGIAIGLFVLGNELF